MVFPTRSIPTIDSDEWREEVLKLTAQLFPATILRALIDSAAALQLEISSTPTECMSELAINADRLMRTTHARARLIQLLTGFQDPDGEAALNSALVSAEAREKDAFGTVSAAA